MASKKDIESVLLSHKAFFDKHKEKLSPIYGTCNQLAVISVTNELDETKKIIKRDFEINDDACTEISQLLLENIKSQENARSIKQHVNKLISSQLKYTGSPHLSNKHKLRFESNKLFDIGVPYNRGL